MIYTCWTEPSLTFDLLCSLRLPISIKRGSVQQILWRIAISIMFTVHFRYAGQVGYVETGMRKTEEALIGDTFCHPDHVLQPLTGFRSPKSMVSNLGLCCHGF